MRPEPGKGLHKRFASREEALAVLAARRPEHSRPALRREILYELIQDPDGAWAWRHHPGHLPVLPGASSGYEGFGREILWHELVRLTAPAALVRSDWAGRLTAADLARLRQHAANVDVITVPGAGEDIAATQPAALATALNQLFPSETQRPGTAVSGTRRTWRASGVRAAPIIAWTSCRPHGTCRYG